MLQRAMVRWLPEMEAGSGYEPVRPSVKGTAVAMTGGIDFTGKSKDSVLRIERVDSTHSVRERLDIGGTAQGAYDGVRVGERTDAVSNIEVNRYSLYLLIYRSVLEEPAFVREPRLTEDARALVKGDLKRFEERFGTHFVRGGRRGGIFAAILELQTSSEREKEDLNAQLKGAYQGSGEDLSASLKGGLSTYLAKGTGNLKVHIIEMGTDDVRWAERRTPAKTKVQVPAAPSTRNESAPRGASEGGTTAAPRPTAANAESASSKGKTKEEQAGPTFDNSNAKEELQEFMDSREPGEEPTEEQLQRMIEAFEFDDPTEDPGWGAFDGEVTLDTQGTLTVEEIIQRARSFGQSGRMVHAIVAPYGELPEMPLDDERVIQGAELLEQRRVLRENYSYACDLRASLRYIEQFPEQFPELETDVATMLEAVAKYMGKLLKAEDLLINGTLLERNGIPPRSELPTLPLRVFDPKSRAIDAPDVGRLVALQPTWGELGRYRKRLGRDGTERAVADWIDVVRSELGSAITPMIRLADKTRSALEKPQTLSRTLDDLQELADEIERRRGTSAQALATRRDAIRGQSLDASKVNPKEVGDDLEVSESEMRRREWGRAAEIAVGMAATLDGSGVVANFVADIRSLLGNLALQVKLSKDCPITIKSSAWQHCSSILRSVASELEAMK